MNRILKYLLIGIAVIAVLGSVVYLIKSNRSSGPKYKTATLEKRTIESKAVATGKIVPRREIEIKPNISGIVQEIYVEEGQMVKEGDLIARISVVSNMSSLNSADSQLRKARIALANSKKTYDRQKKLFDQGVISDSEFQEAETDYQQNKQNVQTAQRGLTIVQTGTASGLGGQGNTLIKATSSGTVLNIPIEIGSQVTEANNLNSGTTIAFIADLGEMIFEGKVDESEVGKTSIGDSVTISVGAISDTEFKAKLNFISPKGKEQSGTIQFEVKAVIQLIDSVFLRAGYSANASITLEKKDSVFALEEALLQFDDEDKPYVEVKISENKYEKRDLKLGISDNEYVEVLSGITQDDKIKIWNKKYKPKKDKKDKGDSSS